MAIVQSVCTSFKKELMQALHDFTASTGNVFKIALYTNAANLDQTTTAYTSTNETVGTGYTAGGEALTNVTPAISGVTAFTDFNDLTWAGSSITARGALIYNSINANRSVVVLNFGSDKASASGDFTIIFPAPDAVSAIIRIA